MQTFLPYPDFAASARCLDNRRLGKQRLECVQLANPTSGWRHHPAAAMWRGYELALAAYRDAVVTEWLARGFRNSVPLTHAAPTALPPWLGNPAFHASHRSNLLRKDPAWYGRYGWTEGPDLPYVWPRP